MKRLLRNTSKFVIMLTLLAPALMWIRSRSTLDEWSLADGMNRACAVFSYQGAIHIFRSSSATSMTRKISWDTQEIPSGADSGSLYGSSVTNWKHLGVVRTSKTSNSLFARIRSGSRTGVPKLAPWLTMLPYEAVAIPYWLFCVPLAILVPLMIRQSYIVWYRKRHRLCPNCGYDLRATPERCPECGTIPTAAKGAAT